MKWNLYNIVFYIFSVFFIGIVVHTFCKKSKHDKIIHILAISSIAVLFLFIVQLWYYLQRPVLRTLGETRLMYSFFLTLIGYIAFFKWKYRWFLAYCFAMAFVFMLINYLKPELHDKDLLPALQSVWFVPHVIVYMIAYALLGASALVAVKGLIQLKINSFEPKMLKLADNLVYLGFAFITMGLVFGALWAKISWGNYWTWDPKETWALLTWLVYLLYMHYSYSNKNKTKVRLLVLSLSFVILLICWFGLKYLPSAQNSVHVYSN